MKKMRTLDAQVFKRRIFLLLMFFSIVQIFYYLVISKHDQMMAITSIIYALGIYIFQKVLFSRVKSGSILINTNALLFAILYLICFFVVIIFSRLAYVMSFMSVGLLETRGANLGQGGPASIIAVWFYPLSIILSFMHMRVKHYYLLCIPLLIVLTIDIVALGTRNAPFFVILFHVLTYHNNFFNFRRIIIMASLLLCSIFIIDFQTKGRSLNTKTIGFTWSLILQHSRVFAKTPVDPDIIQLSKDWSIVGPGVYLSGYIAHSQVEFQDLIKKDVFGYFGVPNYTLDEICLVLFCDRSGFQKEIAKDNPSIGLYMTFFAVILFDFGYVGVFIILFTITYFMLILPYRIYLPTAIYSCFVMSVGLIENYFYNGLGLARFLLFILLWQFFLMSPKVSWKPPVQPATVPKRPAWSLGDQRPGNMGRP